jgi:hypothetical protein
MVNPTNAIVLSTTRTWDDVNRNFFPDCNLNNFAVDGECGAIDNSRFGTVVVGTRYADDALRGFGNRVDNWQTSVSVQQELRSGMAVNVGFFRTAWSHFTTTDNTLVTPADYDSYCITAPIDSRLPGGGGYPVCGLYDINPSKFGQIDNVVTQSSRFGDQQQVYTGIDATFNARFGRGGNLSGGMATGRTMTQCVSADLPSVQFCTNEPPFWYPQFKLAAVYPLPWWGIQTAATFQNLSGIPIAATYVASNAEVAPSLGRNLAACSNRVPCNATTGAIQLIEPNQTFEDRLNQVDLRFTKIFSLGRTRIQGMFDIYNLLNANTVLVTNARYGPSWLRPATILGARLFKLGAQVDF